MSRSHSTLLQPTAKEPEVRALGIFHPETSLLSLQVTSLPVLIWPSLCMCLSLPLLFIRTQIIWIGLTPVTLF